jgi:capsular polysaccharide biosynthesis protein
LEVAVLLPSLVTVGLVLRSAPTYTAHARLVAADATPRSQAEAQSVASQVQAVATSRDIVQEALRDAHIAGDPDKVIKAIVVTGLGSSTLVDLAYTDRSADRAQQVTTTVATAVASQLDELRVGSLPDVLKDMDNQLTELATKRAPIAAAAQAKPGDPVLQNKLAGIDRLISDLSGDRNRLAEDAAVAGHSAVVATPTRPAGPDPRGLPAKLAIAVLVGLVLALILIGVNETLRPSVAGSARVARLLEVTVLGTVGSDPQQLADLGRRLRLAARRAGVTTIVLARANRGTLPPELVDRVEAATLRPDVALRRVAIPVDVDATQVLSLPPRMRGGETNHSDGGRESAVAVLANESSSRTAHVRRVCALSELDPSAESERIGLVVLAAASTRLAAIDGVRDLMAASGWPALGVLGDGAQRAGGRK